MKNYYGLGYGVYWLLTLKISVWEDKNGSVWATFPLMKPMAANYGLENEPVIEKMQTLLENIVIKSASVY